MKRQEHRSGSDADGVGRGACQVAAEEAVMDLQCQRGLIGRHVRQQGSRGRRREGGGRRRVAQRPPVLADARMSLGVTSKRDHVSFAEIFGGSRHRHDWRI